MKKPQMMSLRQVRTFNQVCAMPRDNYDCGNFSIMTDGKTLWLCEQKLKKPATQAFAIPKAKFDKLFDAYGRKRRVVRR